jgi:two-component system, NtrC family, sensor kinase
VVVRQRSVEGEEEKLPIGGRLHASRTIIDHVLATGQGVLSQNAMEDKRFSSGKSVHSMTIRSALCVPIRGRATDAGEAGEILGILYIDSSKKNYTYSPDQLRLLGAIGLQAGMAVQSAKLYQAAIRAERLAAVGETTAALSHAIKNILQAMRGGADVVELGLGRKDLVQMEKGWGVVSRSLNRILGMTQNLLAYSRPRTPQAELVDVGALVRDCVELVAERAAEKKVMVVADESSPRPPKVPMDEDAMHQVVMNLIGNAVDAAAERKGGLVRVMSRLDRDGGEEVALIEVADNGSGVSPTLQPHLFELFHSTKGNKGTGLGLAVSKKIVDEHEGDLSYQQGGELGGAVFRVRLPLRAMEGEGE